MYILKGRVRRNKPFDLTVVPCFDILPYKYNNPIYEPGRRKEDN